MVFEKSISNYYPTKKNQDGNSRFSCNVSDTQTLGLLSVGINYITEYFLKYLKHLEPKRRVLTWSEACTCEDKE